MHAFKSNTSDSVIITFFFLEVMHILTLMYNVFSKTKKILFSGDGTNHCLNNKSILPYREGSSKV